MALFDLFEVQRPEVKLVEMGVIARLVELESLYRQLGLLDKTGKITGEDGRTYPFPSYQGITDLLNKGWQDRYALKVAQGFDTLMIIPGCLPYGRLEQALARAMRDHGGVVRSVFHPERLRMDTENPVQGTWRQSAFLYRRGDLWVTRQTFYQEQPFPGYELMLIRSADRDLPRLGWERSLYGRKDIAAGKTALQYWELLGQGPYLHEGALSADGHLLYYAEQIWEEGLVADGWSRVVGTQSLCVDNWLNAGEGKAPQQEPMAVPSARFILEGGHVNLHWRHVTNGANDQNVRAAVRLTE